MTRTLSSRFGRLLEESEMATVKSRFQEDVKKELEEALRKHHGHSDGSIPKFFWVLLLFFASDNILGWIYSPILFYPFVICFVFFACAFAMGMQGVAKELGISFINQQLRRFNLGFQF